MSEAGRSRIAGRGRGVGCPFRQPVNASHGVEFEYSPAFFVCKGQSKHRNAEKAVYFY